MPSQEHLQRRQPRLPFSFLLITAAACFVLVSSLVAWKLHQRPYDDLPSFYWATQIAFDQAVSPYRGEHFRALSEEFPQKIYPFLYPPPSLLLFSPFLFFDSYEQCKFFFSTLNLLLWWLVVWCVYCLYGYSLQGSRRAPGMTVFIILGTVVFFPVVDTLKNGQVNLLVLACLFPLLMPARNAAQSWISGVLFACAVLLKVYVVLLLPVLLIFGRWREVAAFIVMMVSLTLLSVLLLPQELWSDWLALGQSTGYGKGIPGVLTVPFNQSVNGFFIRMFLEERGLGHGMTWTLWIYLVATACLFVAAYVVTTSLRHEAHGQSITIALSLLLINLLAPLTWLHHYVFALPAAFWAVQLLKRPGVSWWQGCVVIVSLVLLAAPYLPAFLRGQGSLLNNLAQSVPLLGALGLFSVLLMLGRRRSPDPAPLG